MSRLSSSFISRFTACSADSLRSTKPPGRSHVPFAGCLALMVTSSSDFSFVIKAPTAVAVLK